MEAASPRGALGAGDVPGNRRAGRLSFDRPARNEYNPGQRGLSEAEHLDARSRASFAGASDRLAAWRRIHRRLCERNCT
jgi:hypothetical protein